MHLLISNNKHLGCSSVSVMGCLQSLIGNKSYNVFFRLREDPNDGKGP